MNRKSRNLRHWLTPLAVLLGSVSAFAAPDDGEPPPVAAAVVDAFMMDESNFDQWIFQGSGNAAAGRAGIHSHLKLKLDELVRVCELTEAQQKKLMLAASGDMKRFFDDVEVLRKKFLAVKNDQNAFQNIWQEISPLQIRQSAGLFGETSLYAKTLRRTLTDEQQVRYRIVVEERNRFRYRAAIDVSLVTLGNSAGLRPEQHEALLKLLIEETRPPNLFGQNDNYAVMYRLAMLPAQKVRPLVDERQWKLLQQQLNQARGLEAHLAQNGVIDAPPDKTGGVLDGVRNLFGAGFGVEVERGAAAEDRRDAPADALKPERPRRRAER